MDNYIYFIQGVDGGPVKIGTTSDVRKRLRELRIGNPRELQVTSLFVDSDGKGEALAHKAAKHGSIRGEWFSESAATEAFVVMETSHYKRIDFQNAPTAYRITMDIEGTPEIMPVIEKLTELAREKKRTQYIVDLVREKMGRDDED